MLRVVLFLVFMCPPVFAARVEEMSKKRIVIIASYRKYYPEVLRAIEAFEKQGYEVIMPPKSKIVNSGESYVRFENDSADIPMKLIELSFLDAVRRADIIYVLNPKGYIGLSSAFEMGYAFYTGKTIFCAEKPADPNLDPFCKVIGYV